MFRRVALRVNREIGQDPWISASTLPEVYFAGKKPEGPTPEQQLEMAFWASVKDNTDPAVLKTYLERYPQGSFVTAAQALIEQQEQRLKAEAAAREEQKKRAEEARKAAELKRKEEEKRAREAKLAEERRRAEEARNAAEVSRLEQQQRQEALTHAEELRKALSEIEAIKEAAKVAEAERLAAVKALEELQIKNLALANPSDLKAGPRPPKYSDVQAGGLFSGEDAKGVQAHAAKYGISVPDYRFQVPGDDVPLAYRRFVGVWVDEGRTGRPLLMIITRVGKDGSADGFWAFGPPVPTGVTQNPASVFKIAGRISDDTLRFSSPDGHAQYKHTLSGKSITYAYANAKGQTATNVLVPLWTLVEAQQTAKPKAAP